MTGPRLLALIALSVTAMVAWIVITSDGGRFETASTVVRWTARSSLLAFVLVYAARPAMQLWRSPFTRYLLAERKWIGLGYATSHAAHLAGIVVIATPDVGAFVAQQSPATATGAFTFLLLFAMAFTSLDAIKQRMSTFWWKALHRTGIHFSWIAFTGTYAIGVAKTPAYAVPTVILLAIGGMRFAAWLRLRRRHRV